MWTFIFGAVIIFAAVGFIYLISRFYRLELQKKLFGKKIVLRIIASVVEVSAIAAIITLTLGSMNAVVCLLHLTVFWLISDIVFLIIKKARKTDFRRYYAGGAAFIITFAYLLAGWILANNVWQKNYVIETKKNVGDIRVVQIADSHIGTTFDGKEFAEYIKEIGETSPDVLLITGDYVDDDTSKDDMTEACAALGELETKYGVYFVFGNHDKGYYNNSVRGYGAAELTDELESNGVTVLQDETVLIDDRFYIIGRQDRSAGAARATMDELVSELDKDKFSIVMDHQPGDYDAEEAAGVDLVLSGHTHGGQMIPIGPIGELMGANDKTYGMEKRTNTSFIVTSGISDWAIRFKTGCRSEYVVIDIKEK